PPLWSSAALLLSLILGVLYCWTTVELMPGNQGQLFRVYANSAAWSLVPPLPSFARHAHVQTHEFMMPDGSAFRVPPPVLYRNLRSVIYHGRSILLFKGAFVSFASTLFVLLCVGLILDRTHEAQSR